MPKRNSVKLTIPVVKELCCPNEKDYQTRWDNEVVGFGLRAYPNGSKSFVFRYRQNGQKKLITIGKFGTITLDQARDKAKKLSASVVDGEDPAREKKAKIAKDKRTLAAVSVQYLEEYANKKKKARSAARDEGLLRLHILPRLGSMPITSITRQEIRKLHHEMGLNSEFTANRAIAVLSKLFNIAEEWGYRPEGSNPCRHVKKFPEHERERIVTNDELERLGRALTKFELENPEYHRPFVHLIKLLSFTGARLGEIVNARWEDLDDENQNLRVVESKTGRKVIPLSEQARLILSEITRLEHNPFIITGDGKEGRVGEIYRRWTRLLEIAEIQNLRIHDLRHNFATRGAMSGHSLYMIGSVLGHTNPSTTKRYAHQTETPMHQFVDTVGANISALLIPNANSAEIIQLQKVP